MSTEPTPTPDARPTTERPPTETRSTEIAARGREDPWVADDGAAVDPASPAAGSQFQFDPRSIARLCNLVDEANAYCR